MQKLLIGVLAIGILLLVIFSYKQQRQVLFGVSFSPNYARYLKLDWQKTYIEILDGLQVKKIRITSYWNILEPKEGQYDFSETDFMLDEASKRGAKVIMVLGARQPRWPECHIPMWARFLTVIQRQERILEFIKNTVTKYKGHPEVWAWQVENEPLFGNFGEGCDTPDKRYLQKEVELVKTLSQKPVILTDSGELGFWVTSMRFSDIFGTTMYRTVYDKFLGYVTYPLPPSFYIFKSNLIRNFFAPNNLKTINVELQAEPWRADGDFPLPDKQSKLFTVSDFKNNIDFAKKTGFEETYLWGVEWWYFMAAHGYPEYLEYAKALF